MSKRYQGDGKISGVAGSLESDSVYLTVQMEPKDINMFNRLMDGFAHLAFVVPVQPKVGIVGIHTTSDNFSDLQEVLGQLPVPLRRVKIKEEGLTSGSKEKMDAQSCGSL